MDKRIPVIFAIAMTCPCAMRFHVTLVKHIKAVFVTQMIKFRRIRIMRSANGVDVMLLHQLQIHYHLLARSHIAGIGIAVVTVYTFELDRLTVDKQHITLSGYRANSDRVNNSFL
ncbi:hypothetical protein D3C85_1598740 [compost metagenome]